MNIYHPQILQENSMKIIIAITGGIAAYKAVDVISGFVNKGYDIKVMKLLKWSKILYAKGWLYNNHKG